MTAETIQLDNECLIGITDPDATIYRIFPLWFFEEVLRLRQLVLVPPQRWEDPFEVLASDIMMEDRRSKPYLQQSLEPYLRPVFAQCWSRTQESDTLLRAYSRVVKDPHFKRNTDPQQEGVRVRSSATRLIRAAKDWAASLSGVLCFVGAVQYKTRDNIMQHLANLVCQHGPNAFGVGRLRAEQLLLKRTAFSHEDEVRLICVDERGISDQEVTRIPIDPNELFEEVTFDPRLSDFERIERETVARSLGYKGPFMSSDLYKRTLIQLPLPNGWEKPPKKAPKGVLKREKSDKKARSQPERST
jgi:hypothetical protein